MNREHKEIKGWSEHIGILWHFFRPYRLRMVFVLFTMFFAGLLESANLAAIYPILNYGLNLHADNVSIHMLNTMIGQLPFDNLFVASCVFLIIIAIISSIFRIYQHYVANKLIADVVKSAQHDIFEKFQNADYRFYIKSQQGKLVYAGTVAPIGVSSNVLFSIRLVNSFIVVLLYTLLLIYLTWQGTLLVGLMGACYVLFVRRLIIKVVNRAARIAVEQDREKNVILNEMITGIKAIKVFQNQHFWREKFSDAVYKSVWSNFKVNMGRIIPDTFVKLLFFVIFASAGIFLSMKSQGSMIALLPLMGTFVTVASRLFPYMNLVGNDIVSIARFMPDAKVVHELLHENIEEIKEGSDELFRFDRSIQFKDVAFRYEGMDHDLLKGISFVLEKGKALAIVGPSGSGKSTIISLLFRLYDVDKGVIQIDGKDIRTLKLRSYLAKFGYVGQETFIFNGTIRENIQFGLKESTEEEIVAAAKLANAHEFILRTEKGYDTIVGDAGSKLSGGQRQRIAIARAMLRKPEILVLDEATSSLDNIAEKAVQEAINNVSQYATILIVAHRLSTVQNADKIIVLDNGKIVEEGIHKDLLHKKSSYFNLYAAQGS